MFLEQYGNEHQASLLHDLHRRRTTECSCKLCPIPGIYAVTSKPDVRLTRATLRIAEFGFFGVVVYTRVQTPRRCGQFFNAGDFVFLTIFLRGLRINCCTVGILLFFYCFIYSLSEPYFFMKRSTRPSVSKIFKEPV